jgi:membrane protease YdiL (CAAX protease family)
LLLLRAKFNETTMSARAVGLSFKDFGRNIRWGIGAWVACIPILLASAMIGYALFFWMPAPSHPITEELRTSQSGIQVLLLFLAAAVGAPLYEELVFRGTLLPALTRLKNNRWFGIILCGLLFAAIHPTGVPAWFALASIGSMAAFVTYQTGSLIPAIVMHAVHNGVLVMATRLLL